MSATRVLSVGIDVGTTTSQVVVSRLTVSNRSRAGMVPRLEIEDREILFQSEPALTPLLAPDEVDVDRLTQFVRAQYAAAGIDPAQIATGAVIITGETARTKNAEAILRGLADLAGDFVVTVAGPNVESQMAARGSGAAGWSSHRFATVVNVDIGGGSSNAAVFRSGQHVASSAIMVGGRQAVIDPVGGLLVHLAPPGQAIVRDRNLRLVVGQRPDLAELRRFCDVMADLVVDLCLGLRTPLGERVALSRPYTLRDRVGAFFISGGVGALYYDEAPATTFEEITRYGDVGPLLAKALRENPRLKELPVERPAQTLRATVLGAASQQVNLSGSTIWAEPRHLPLRNLPVIEPELPKDLTESGGVARAVEHAVHRWDGSSLDGCAVMLSPPSGLKYAQVVGIAQGMTDYASRRRNAHAPLVMVLEEDYAQVLGQTIRGIDESLPLIVVDQVGLGEGDYIDIGEPMFDGRVVPVSVKTLIFYGSQPGAGEYTTNGVTR